MVPSATAQEVHREHLNIIKIAALKEMNMQQFAKLQGHFQQDESNEEDRISVWGKLSKSHLDEQQGEWGADDLVRED